MNKKISIVLIALILLASSAAYDIVEGDAKSTKDPLFLEFVGDVHHYMPTTVKLHINDPIIKKEAQYAEISTSEYAYSLDGNKIVDTSGGTFRQTMKYDGQDNLQFGFRTQTYPKQKTSISVDFYKVKFSDEEYPDTSAGTEFEGYNCGREYSKLFCQADSCTVCAYYLGSIIREYVVSETTETISTPGRFDFVDEKKADKSINEFTVNFEKFSHNAEVNVINNLGKPYTGPENYYLRLTSSPGFKDLSEQKEFQMRFAKQGYQEVKETTPPGGMTGGFAFEALTYTPPKDMGEKANFEWADIKYKLMTELLPKGSGYLTVEASRYGPVGKGQAAAERDRVISEVKSFVASYTLTPGPVYKPSEELRHTYYVRDLGQKVEETTDLYVYGTVADTDSNPMPYVMLEVQLNKEAYQGRTDENGDFSIKIDGIKLKQGEEANAKILVGFNYERDGKQYFFMRNLAGNIYKDIIVAKEFTVKEGENSELHLKLDGANDPKITSTVHPYSDVKSLSVMYYHFHEAVDFALTKLKANIELGIPVDISVGNAQGNTWYDYGPHQILISANTASYTSKDKPKNREYHEFSHHLLYSQYGGDLPTGRRAAGTVAHGGFTNPNTADSFIEGFAEFNALAISKDRGDKNPELYASWGSLEQNLKPYDGGVVGEEMSIAGILWDLYDTNNDKGDSMSLSLDEIWDILKVKRADFYEYYKAFKAAYPDKSKEIDAIFIEHGFFADTTIGNHKYDSFEPWRYVNGQSGPYIFSDLGAKNNTAEIKFKEGMDIGRASNYERNRTSAARVQNAFVLVSDENKDVRFYKVTVKSDLPEYSYYTEQREGKIYLQPLPGDVDGTLTVTPDVNGYTGKPFIIDNRELVSKINSAARDAGSFESFNFGLKKTDKDVSPYVDYNNIEPSYKYETDAYVESKAHPFKFPYLTVIFALALGGFVYLFARKKGFRNGVVSGAKKGASGFRKHVWPMIVKISKMAILFLLKVIKWLWMIIVRLSKLIFHHTKKAYHATKPHVVNFHSKLKKQLKKKK
ncbi:MAG: hypothetical protein ABIJ34_00735 [archaeon]